MRLFKRANLILTKAALIAVLTTSSVVGPFTGRASAAVANSAPAAKISFTFDEGYNSSLTQAAPALAAYGLSGTTYISTGCMDMTTVPNTCHANNDAAYMSWSQVKALRDTYGWEIGSHTVSHPYLASSDAEDGQPNVLTPQQVTDELVNSKAALAAHGFDANAFATPYGDYSPYTLAQIAKYYTSHRGFADQRTNDWPYNEYLLNNMPVQAGVSVKQVKSKIDQAIANKQWLVLTFHDIKTKPSGNPDDYEYSTANLSAIAAYVKTKRAAGLLQPVNVSQGLVTGDTNLLSNSSFDSGLGGGWSTDNANSFKADAGNNGSYPGPANSIKFGSNSTVSSHFFSPKVNINQGGSYILKSFLNVQSLASGGVGFYIDEYDTNGNWISGQYKKGESSSFVENINFAYSPSSSNVHQARLQIFINGVNTGYLDNIQWLVNNAGTPPVQPTNLIVNGTFDSGLGGGWSTDNANSFKADAGNNGSPTNPINSVALTAGVSNSHLFSPKVAVSNTRSYSLSSWLNVGALASGEVGFYIDEYDASGNWISGQYKTGARTAGTYNISFGYIPSSVNVDKASLQVILTGNSGIAAYFDDVRWY